MMDSPKILIVDDEKNLRLTMSMCLEPLGCEIDTADDGEDALKQLDHKEFDLVLLDIRLPRMDGIEVLRQAVERNPNVRIIMVSAHGTVENAVEAMKLGAVDFIQKPFTPKEIRDLVQQVLDREGIEETQALDYDAHIQLAKRCASRRQFEAAMGHTKKAIAADPSRPQAFNLLGGLQEIMGERTNAVKNYRVAVDLDPTYKPAQQNLDRAITARKMSQPNLG
jgi:DNA-binding NtrC family response regulator